MRNILSIPFLLPPFIAFNLLLVLKPDLLDYRTIPLFTLELPTTGILRLSASDLIVASAILLLALQIYKNSKVQRLFFIERLGSILILVALIGEFIMIRTATNSHCILLIFISLLDVINSLFSRRKRDIVVSNIL